MAQQHQKETKYNGSRVNIIIPKLRQYNSSLRSEIENSFERLGIPYTFYTTDVDAYGHNFVICIDSSRLESDVKEAFEDIPLIEAKKHRTCILYLRNIEKAALNTEIHNTYEVFKENQYLKYFGSIIDCVYRNNFELYDCNVNTKAGILIHRFLNRVKTHFSKTCDEKLHQPVAHFFGTKLELHRSCDKQLVISQTQNGEKDDVDNVLADLDTTKSSTETSSTPRFYILNPLRYLTNLTPGHLDKYCIIYLQHHTDTLVNQHETFSNEFGCVTCIDLVYNDDFEIYDCEVNATAVILIRLLLNKVKINIDRCSKSLQLGIVQLLENELKISHDLEIKRERRVIVCQEKDIDVAYKNGELDNLKNDCVVYLRDQQFQIQKKLTLNEVVTQPNGIRTFKNVINCAYNTKGICDCQVNTNARILVLLCLNRVTIRFTETCPENIYQAVAQLVADELRATPVIDIENERFIFVLCYARSVINKLDNLRAAVKAINPKENYCRYLVLRSDSEEISVDEISELNTRFQDRYLHPYGSVINCIYNRTNEIYDCKINFETRIHIRRFLIRVNILASPWREIGSDTQDAKFRNALIDDIKGTKPKSLTNNMNIAIIGKIGAGKSSYINTIASTAEGYVSKPARTGPKSKESVTTKYKRHRINFGTSHNIWLCDTRGIDYDFDLKSQDLDYLLKGHIKDGYVFDASKTIQPSDQHFVKRPVENDKIHCVCFVFDATTLATDKVLPFKRFLNKIAEDSELRTVTVLTKMDKVCEHVLKDVSNMYKSKRVDDLVKMMASKLEIDTNDIVPVVNYFNQTENDISIDISALLALRQMLRRCRDFTSN